MKLSLSFSLASLDLEHYLGRLLDSPQPGLELCYSLMPLMWLSFGLGFGY